jgi:hypothetical protein
MIVEDKCFLDTDIKIKVGITELRQLLFQLPQSDLVELFEELESRMETFEMMRLAESAFSEWLNDERPY